MKTGVADIKTHPFFSETDWIAIHEQQVSLYREQEIGIALIY